MQLYNFFPDPDLWVTHTIQHRPDIFHCFRHSYATLQLASGTDIYTVSKMLGHTNVKTTQIYAKVVDEKKNKAAQAIKLDTIETKNQEQPHKNQ